MMRKPSEHQGAHSDHDKAEDDITCVVWLVRPVRRVSGAVVTHDTDADQHERS